jgi:hypothetical protein
MVRLMRSTKVVLICQPYTASTYGIAVKVPIDHVVPHTHQATAPILFDHLRIEQCR